MSLKVNKELQMLRGHLAQNAAIIPNVFQYLDLGLFFREMAGEKMDIRKGKSSMSNFNIGEIVMLKGDAAKFRMKVRNIKVYSLGGINSTMIGVDILEGPAQGMCASYYEHYLTPYFEEMESEIRVKKSESLNLKPDFFCQIGQHTKAKYPMQLVEKQMSWYDVCKFCGAAIEEFDANKPAPKKADPYK